VQCGGNRDSSPGGRDRCDERKRAKEGRCGQGFHSLWSAVMDDVFGTALPQYAFAVIIRR
jgi:hypothetical protein